MHSILGSLKGTANQNYYVRIDGVGTGAGGVDTFEVALGNDSTFSSPVLTKTAITGNDQMIHSTDNISIKFGQPRVTTRVIGGLVLQAQSM